ncbi:protease [Pedobacter aquatilis]|uniref:protease n=1 Tax=Pedobacter aquatilis TaxID=351343 RepID=UPI0025B4271B|nr:protease [Pedobacter aquatilis]MDN3588547.1 protease [Pedobacter aquatilis]
MKYLKLIIPILAVLFTACSQSQKNTSSKEVVDSTNTVVTETIKTDSLTAVMTINNIVKQGSPVKLKFTVTNNSDSTRSFCKWHTPFEPFISKYLDIKDANGVDVAYKGAMAKRIMPPPADSYISVKSKDSVSSEVDLLQAYDLKPGNKYTLIYNGSGMSGLSVLGKISFDYEK